MGDHDAFIAAIIASPDDDLPRLIFADWLEERGEAERAEFIRVQIRMAELGRLGIHANRSCNVTGQCAECGREVDHDRLRRRERELLDARLSDDPVDGGMVLPNFWQWADGIFPAILNAIFEYRRGFVETLQCTWQEWQANADAIRTSTPLRKVRLTTWPDRGQHSIQSDLDTGMTVLFYNYPGIEFILPRAIDPRRIAQPARAYA